MLDPKLFGHTDLKCRLHGVLHSPVCTRPFQTLFCATAVCSCTTALLFKDCHFKNMFLSGTGRPLSSFQECLSCSIITVPDELLNSFGVADIESSLALLFMPGTGHSEEPGPRFLPLRAHKLHEKRNQTRSVKRHQESHPVGNQSQRAEESPQMCVMNSVVPPR